MSQDNQRYHSFPKDDILLRLPVKSLMRFMCVSQSWKSLIFSPDFVKLHLQRSPKNTDFLLLRIDTHPDPAIVLSYTLDSLKNKTNPPFTQSLGFSQDLKFCHWVNSSINGLSCVSSYVSNDTEYKIYNVRLWNPITRLTSAASQPLYVENRSACIVKFGLGYDDSTDTYKVVVNIIDREQWKNELRVYSRGDTCWRTVSVSPEDLLFSWEESQFVCNSFNWLVIQPSEPVDRKRLDRFEYTNDDYFIFSLDAGEKTQKLLRMPPDLDVKNRRW
ncbi:hypothetical protein PIB30_092679 [Stylosanthes scabra]|uniref:F-box domain-containing protein n=1 Tax=Stylosanthes scabra TaxID=79078 RepID=A0ABU6WT86_9FABA|nr:hypothetical protein [Stylosanthes scabra]